MTRPARGAPDQPQRDAAVRERRRNVLVDAGAGTGKTSILVERLVEMVAPRDGRPGVSIERIAAITFTRKAAGELRLRIRQRLLKELARPDVPGARMDRLRHALAALDTACIGTSHSFADRLLRLRPVEAELSPSYEISDGGEELIQETFETLMETVQSGTLADTLGEAVPAELAAGAAATVVLALGVGLRSESEELEWTTRHGLDALVAGFIRQRDIPPPDRDPAPFDLSAFRAVAGRIVDLAAPIRGGSPGAKWLRQAAAQLNALGTVNDPSLIFRALRRLEAWRPRDAKKGQTFDNDDAAWAVWKQLATGTAPLWQELSAPPDRWMATRLVRLFPVVVALHDHVKARNQALDQLDLLVKLRDLLVRDRAVRGDLQRMFDHVFVDEFQDTDPLQAEIVLFLCEREPVAARWDDVVLREGALTLVGDPKQSIYRFRRADVAMYDRVRQVVARGEHLAVTLSANFRSAPALVDWLNDRFDRVLGHAPDRRIFDAATGQVFQQPLLPGREGPGHPAVHVLPFDFADGARRGVDDYRTLEGEALARYLRWLVEASDVEIEDAVEQRPRRPRYGDIAVLAISTWNLMLLFEALDAAAIPYASRGGTLFVADPRHRQFLLALRALADRDDGIAEAALLRPPFFALDPADLLRARATGAEGSADDGVRRVREAHALIRELRRRRFERPPGATARDLLERTAFGRHVALGPNGAQRLARLRELCFILEQTCADEGFDFDAATARLRAWVERPAQLDPPHPVAGQTVSVLTVHQAKGLEFPVVVLWDGKGRWDARLDPGAWRMERDGRGWTMRLHGLEWEEPQALNLVATERQYLDHERRRVVYVAATRARDLFVVPCAGTVAPGKIVCADLLAAAPAALVRELPLYRAGAGAGGAHAPTPRPDPAPRSATEELERATSRRWDAARTEAARPRLAPVSVSGEARRRRAEPDEAALDPALRKPREGRFGHLFGSVVHAAIGFLVRDPGLVLPEAVRRAAGLIGLAEHLDDAEADVARALTALRAEGLVGPVGPGLQLEYPIAGAADEATLLNGYIDLVGAVGDRLDIIDFKTDRPPAGEVAAVHPEYVAQVQSYARLLDLAGMTKARRVRCGLLFTADGLIRWVPMTRDPSA
jgi:ATP-dependent helicase/nuclease subunit A